MAIFVYNAKRRIIPAHVQVDVVNNGSFTSNAIGWSSQNGIISSVNSRLNIAYTNNRSYAHQNLVIAPNQKYEVKITKYTAAHDSYLVVSNSFTTLPVGVIESIVIPAGALESRLGFVFSSSLALCNVSASIGDPGEIGTGVFDDITCKIVQGFTLSLPIDYSLSKERMRSVSRSLGGNTQSLIKSTVNLVSVTLSQIALVDVPEIEEFLYSVSRGEEFQFGRDEETLSAGETPTAQLEGGWTKSRMNNSTYFSFSFTCRLT